MDTAPSWVGSARNWIIVGIGFLWFSALMGLVSYVSLPPANPLAVTGTVVSVSYRTPARSPKFNIFIKNEQGELHLYTDLGKIQSKVAVGDVVQAGYDADVFGRNFHRIWDLRRGDEVLFSREHSYPAATAEAHQIGWFAFFIAIFSAAVVAVGVGLRVRFRPGS